MNTQLSKICGTSTITAIMSNYTDSLPEDAVARADQLRKRRTSEPPATEAQNRHFERILVKIRKHDEVDDAICDPEIVTEITNLILSYPNTIVTTLVTAANALHKLEGTDLLQSHDRLSEAIEDFSETEWLKRFTSNDFPTLATYVRITLGGNVFAISDREYVVNGDRVSRHKMESFVQQLLEDVELYEEDKRRNVKVCRRIISEVCGAIVRKWPLFEAPDSGEAPDLEKCAPSTFARFAREVLRLEINAWETSATLYDVYNDWCRRNRIPPLGHSTFFRELSLWGNDGIKRSRRRSGKSFVPRYEGVRVVAEIEG